jgi:tetratricopeptide (TPR) repeat protein
MMDTWQKGALIQNRWEVCRILSGGMGMVYAVYDCEHRTVYAVKTFKDEVLKRGQRATERFRQEALAWVKLEAHPNIVRAGWYELISGRPCLFLEYVSGGDLSAWIGTPRLMKAPLRVLRYALQICDALAYAASKGIPAHRDIKPRNCLITEYGLLKITDFGLAKVLDAPASRHASPPSIGIETNRSDAAVAAPDLNLLGNRLTLTGEGAGTPAYMAPEQFQDFKRADVRCDIYSAGVMLYEMLTGRLPFIGSSWKELAQNHMTLPVPLLPPELSGFQEIVQVCMAKDPAHRFADFLQLRTALEELWRKQSREEVPAPALPKPVDAVLFYNKGASLVALGRYEEGIPLLDKALMLDPGSWEAWGNKAVALEGLGRAAEALDCCERGLAANPNTLALWVNKSSALVALERHAEAMACAERAIVLDEYSAVAWLNKGRALMGLSRVEEALSCCNYAVANDPRSHEAWLLKGLAMSGLKRPLQALNCFEHCIEIGPHRSQGWSGKAEALLATQRCEEAGQCFDQALTRGAAAVPTLRGKGLALLFSERPLEALACFEKALELNREDSAAWFGRGLALLMADRRPEAMASLLQAEKHKHPHAKKVAEVANRLSTGQRFTLRELWEAAGHGSDFDAGQDSVVGLASALFGRPAEAVQHFQRALARDPGSAAVWFNKGKALLELQAPIEALDCFDKAAELDPRDPEIWINRGAALGGLGRLEEELDSYNRAIQLNPDYTEAWFNKSVVLVALKRACQAVESLDQLLRIDPADADAWFNKGTLLANELQDYAARLGLFCEGATVWPSASRACRSVVSAHGSLRE